MVFLCSCEPQEQISKPVEQPKAPEDTRVFPQADGAVVVKVETTMGVIVLELNSKQAPITVANFVQYVKDGAYDGTIFHRVMSGFMIQGGGFNEERVQKEPRATIKNESNAALPNKRGTIAMARTPELDSATNQFFINHNDNFNLNGDGGKSGYAVFGKVVEGMDVVDAIAAVKTIKTKTTIMTAREEINGKATMTKRPFKDVPVENVVITKMSVVGAN
ncbi:MAG: peptidylprolyl isomerase [Anaerohalosphaera sp.]|nr:peptidylprolyl isomerase [Anaerohalosphaera sp.]